MNRRKFLIGAGAAIISLQLSAASGLSGTVPKNDSKGQPESDLKNHYIAIGNYKDDANRVFMFISFDCPYCAQSWQGVGEWALKLPPPFKFVYVPVLGTPRKNVAGTAFYIVRELAPHRLPEFMSQAFSLASSRINNESYIDILYKMGFTKAQVEGAYASQITKRRVERAIKLTNNYRIDVTPSFGIAGRYMTHIDLANGDTRFLTNIVNRLITIEIERTFN